MNENPIQPPLDGPAGSPAPLEPAASQLIAERIRRLNRNSLLIGGLGFALQIAGQLVAQPTGKGLGLVGTLALIYGLSLYARMRNQSPWWGAAGLLSCLGILILLLLPKRCHHCGAKTKRQNCENCGAPAPL